MAEPARVTCPLRSNRVFHADRDAGIGRNRTTGLALMVMERRLFEGSVAIEGNEGPGTLAGRVLDALQRGFDQGGRRHGPLIEITRQSAQWLEHRLSFPSRSSPLRQAA